MQIRRALAVCACLALGVSACSDEPSAPDAAPDVQLIVISGNNQEGPPGQELPQPLVAEVRNAAGEPQPDVLVNFRVVSGGGRPYAGTARTNALGRAQDYWTLGPVPGTAQVLEVRAVRNGQKRVYATFTATALVPAAPPAEDE